MESEPYYAEVGGTGRTPLSYFMLLSVLRGRIESGTETPAGEEDVNMYLAATLGAAADPKYMTWARSFIFERDTDIFRSLEETGDLRRHYTTYKVNADHLLLAIGIFDREHHEAVRGKSYYGLANSLGYKLARRRTALTEVLDKMSANFDRYVALLGVVRREYFNLVDSLSERALAEIQRDVVAQQLAALIDQLLDVYGAWLRASRPAQIEEMRRLLGQIRQIRPDFAFELPLGSSQ